MSHDQELEQSFAGQVARLTEPRKIILNFLSKSKQHMSVKEIYASLRASHPSLGLSTVYRTLDLLARMNVVAKISIGDGHSRYEFKPVGKEGHHHHLICTKCGIILNYSEFMDEELRLVNKTEEKLSKKFNFIIEDHNIEYFGICTNCR